MDLSPKSARAMPDAKHCCLQKNPNPYVLMSEGGERAFEFACGWFGRKDYLASHPCFITHGAPLYGWAEALRLDKSEDGETCIPYSVWFYCPDFKSALEATLAAVAGTSTQFANMVTPPGRMWLVMLCAIAHAIKAKIPAGDATMKAIYNQVRTRLCAHLRPHLRPPVLSLTCAHTHECLCS